MPFYKEITNKYGSIGIWKLTEDAGELLEGLTLSENDAQRFSRQRSPRRKTEFLASRLLLQRALGATVTIEYQQHGKPFLSPPKAQISISHSADFAVLFLSQQNVGVDIERENRNIDPVCSRFLHPDERAYLNTLNNQQQAKMVYWSAKEAIFKCTETNGISFQQQIRIDAFNPETEHRFTAKLIEPQKTTHFELHSLFFENNVLVFCVEQENQKKYEKHL